MPRPTGARNVEVSDRYRRALVRQLQRSAATGDTAAAGWLLLVATVARDTRPVPDPEDTPHG